MIFSTNNATRKYFIGLKIPQNIRKTISDAQYGLHNVSWADESNFHITIKYLGELSGERFHSIGKLLKSIHYKPFILILNRFGYFAKDDGSGVIWIGIKNSGRLSKIKKDIDFMLLNENIQFDLLEYIPHITIGSFVDLKQDTINKWTNNGVETKIAELEVRSFYLFESIESNKTKYIERMKFTHSSS